MALDIHRLIATINADAFCDKTARRDVKRILAQGFERKDSLTYVNAAARARPFKPNQISMKNLELLNPFSLPGLKSPIERHTLVYDNMDDSMEAFYFWLLDELTRDEWKVAKLLDNFAAAPGSGLYGEMGQRGVRAQEQAAKMLREIRKLVPEILRSADQVKAESSTRQRSEPKDSQVAFEKHVLRSKLEELMLYVRWLGPHLRWARDLEQPQKSDAALVKVFNTSVVDVLLLAEREYALDELVQSGTLPKMLLKASARKYFPVLIIEIHLRASPERVPGGGYAYHGQMETVLTSYALNQDELAVLRQEIERGDLREVLGLVAGNTGQTWSDLVNKLENLLAEPEPRAAEPEDTNPFSALFAFKESAAQEAPQEGIAIARPIRPDSDFEEIIRSEVILEARRRCLDMYERQKQQLQMASWSKA